jgi:hypothetical protein
MDGDAMRVFHSLLSTVVLAAGLALSSTSYADFTRIEESHPSVSYEGNWSTVNGSAVSGGSVKVASAAGARVTVTFRGTGISWIGYRCDCAQGTAWIYVDGVRKVIGQAIPSNSTPEAQSPIYTINGLNSSQPHTLTIELTGENIAGNNANTYVVIDGFDIENGAPLRTLQENDPAVTYTGAWMDIDDPTVSGGSVVATQQAGATATVRFSGNTVRWISYLCPCTGGITEVSIDGRVLSSVNAYAPQRQAQVPISSYTNLADGDHAMTLRVTGASQAGSANNWVVVDSFLVDASGSDTNAPQAVMTSPANEASVTGVVTLEAEATDDVGVTKVQFWAQPFGGSWILLGEDSQAPYSLTRDTSRILSGLQFRLKVRAWDAASNYSESPVVIATVKHTEDTTPPVVSITSPAAGSTVSGPINITASATDNGLMHSVRFIIDFLSFDYIMTAPIYEPPYVMPFDTRYLKDGFHKLEAIAMDKSANMSTTAITITVDNSVQPGRVRLDDDDPRISYSAGWQLDNDGEMPRFHWDSAAYSSTPGATATLTFQGTGILWHGYGCEQCGNATVSIDGGQPQAVDTFRPDRPGEGIKLGTVVYTSPTLASGTHTIEIKVQAPTRTNANFVYVDALEVLQ